MHLLWGILLGLVLTAALPLIAGLLTVMGLAESNESMLVAVALVGFCLLGVILFKPSEASRPVRMVRGRIREDKE